MFKLPSPPSPKADTHEIADFAELLCWQQGRISERDLLACLGRLDDNEFNIGCDDDEDENAEHLDEVMNEIAQRNTACGGGYPFSLDHTGTILKREHQDLENAPISSLIYLYLLLSNRLDMQKSRVHAEIDGTFILEELSSHILRNYLGKERSQVFVFGTSKSTSFRGQVNELCEQLGEGGCFRSLVDGKINAKDGKLDTVAWIPFSDCLPGQLIIFAQCKTGTNWRDSVSQLKPLEFNKKWMNLPFMVDPIRAFCLSEAVNRYRWKETSVDCGILFDRCRIVDLSHDLPSSMENKIKSWTAAALQTLA